MRRPNNAGISEDFNHVRARMLVIRSMAESDAEKLSLAFADIGWHKPVQQFLKYVEEQAAEIRAVRVAEVAGEVAGYVTVQWQSDDVPLRQSDVPEIKDLNVLPGFRERGIGGRLLSEAERLIAARSAVAGLRVGLHSGYGAAQRMYIRHGYVPDGAGIVDAAGNPVPEGVRIAIDDAVTIRLLKRLEP
jgi:ribosomal protein S18 acetylase RimI-like enzyme